MPAKTVVRENETIEDALRRFKRDVSKNGNLQEARKREFYELKQGDAVQVKVGGRWCNGLVVDMLEYASTKIDEITKYGINVHHIPKKGDILENWGTFERFKPHEIRRPKL